MSENLLCIDCPDFTGAGHTFGKCKVDGSIVAFYWACSKNEKHKEFLDWVKLHST